MRKEAISTSSLSPPPPCLPLNQAAPVPLYLEAPALGLFVQGVARLLPELIRLPRLLVEAPHAIPPLPVRRPVVLLLPLCGAWMRGVGRQGASQVSCGLGGSECAQRNATQGMEPFLRPQVRMQIDKLTTDLVVGLPDGDLVRRVLPLRDLHARLLDEALRNGDVD